EGRNMSRFPKTWTCKPKANVQLWIQQLGIQLLSFGLDAGAGFVGTEPPAVAGGAAACFAAALLQLGCSVVLTGAGHSAISGPPPTGGGSV
ncbi:MAG TPA: hypothetical protein VJR04_05100, partial [Terriglobales bacterium]|nr:hypothetical protein [Terriglobales bacterium]